MTENIVTDALGNPIVIGNRYGYSQQKNGFIHITVGKVDKAANGKIRITEYEVHRFLYGKPYNSPLNDADNPRKYVTVYSAIVFPVA